MLYDRNEFLARMQLAKESGDPWYYYFASSAADSALHRASDADKLDRVYPDDAFDLIQALEDYNTAARAYIDHIKARGKSHEQAEEAHEQET